MMYAGIVREAKALPAASHILAAVHTKAHRGLQEAESDLDRWAILSNEAADNLAKSALQLHPPIEEAILEAEKLTSNCTEVLGHVSRALKLWPQPAGLPPRRARKERQPPPLPPPAARHAWARDRHSALWRCSRCCQVAACPATRRVCRGAPKVLDSYRREPKGHRLVSVLADNGTMLFMCSRCSAWSVGKRAVNLGRPCPAPTWDIKSRQAQQAKTVINRVLRGIHPDPRTRARLLPTRAFEAAVAQEGHFSS